MRDLGNLVLLAIVLFWATMLVIYLATELAGDSGTVEAVLPDSLDMSAFLLH